jgi:dCMP deaminase
MGASIKESLDGRENVANGHIFLDAVSQLGNMVKSRPSWDDYFMGVALLIRMRSACERLHVGCVLVSGGEHANRIVAAGYNGFLPGVAHVSHVRDGHEQATVHAEQNAVADAARRGISLQGAVVYVTHFPCINCAKLLASAGVRGIKYHWNYRNDVLVNELLAASGVLLEHYGPEVALK